MKVRKSNFELLRIIAMILIIMHHYFIHSGLYPNSFSEYNNTTIFIQFISSFGKFGSTLFLLISSYFLIESEITYKKIIPIIVKILFFSIIMLIVVIVFTQENITISIIISSLFPVIWGGNWFIIFYIILFLFLPFINPSLKSLTKTQYSKLVILIIIVWSIIPTFSGYAWFYSGFDYFLFIYIIGGYLKLHYTKLKSKYFYINSFIIIILLMLLFIIITDILGLKYKSNTMFNSFQNFYQLNSFIPILASLSIFLFFQKIEIKSKIINYISSSMLSTYLIHDNFLFRNVLWNSFFPNLDYVNTNLFIPHFILKVLFVFFICVFVDKVFAYTLEKPLNNIANTLFDNIKKMIIKNNH